MPNTCVEDDKENLRKIAKALGKSSDWLTGRGCFTANKDVSNWNGITVVNQRATYIKWDGLSGEIPKELGQLTGLQYLLLHTNWLLGETPDSDNHADTQKFLEKCRNNRVSCIICYRGIVI